MGTDLEVRSMHRLGEFSSSKFGQEFEVAAIIDAETIATKAQMLQYEFYHNTDSIHCYDNNSKSTFVIMLRNILLRGRCGRVMWRKGIAESET